MGRSGIAAWAGGSWVEGNKHSAEDNQLPAGAHKPVLLDNGLARLAVAGTCLSQLILVHSLSLNQGKEPVDVHTYVDTSTSRKSSYLHGFPLYKRICTCPGLYHLAIHSCLVNCLQPLDIPQFPSISRTA